MDIVLREGAVGVDDPDRDLLAVRVINDGLKSLRSEMRVALDEDGDLAVRDRLRRILGAVDRRDQQVFAGRLAGQNSMAAMAPMLISSL